MSSYGFIDTTETPSTQGKPAEALKFNGVYLEDEIPGYRTLYVKGRESLFADVDTYEVGLRDGSVLRSRRFPERVITVGYQLICATPSAFRAAYNKLNTMMNTQDATLIFDDESDKYFIGTPVDPDDVEPGLNAVVGELSFLCNDPFKYAKTLTTVETTDYTETVTDEDGVSHTVTSQVLTTDNSGGYKTFPIFNVQFATDEDASGDVGSDADCGYVLFAKGGTDYSVQIGNDAEKDIESVTVVSHNFTKSNKGSFTDSNSLTPFRSKLAFNGSSKATSLGLQINSTTDVAKKFHGPLALYTIASGQRPAGEFSLTWKNVFACSKDTAVGKKECGAVWIMLLDASDVVKFAYGIEKSVTSSLNAKEYVYSYNSGLWPAETLSAKYTGKAGYKTKSDTQGRLSEFFIKRALRVVDEVTYGDVSISSALSDLTYRITETELSTIAKIGIFIGEYGSASKMHSNRVTNVKFVNGTLDNINSFGSGDLAVVDCGKAEIILNDKPAADLGDVGNNWEDMYLDPGTNTIYVQYSDWVAAGYAPTITMAYRRRWL